MLATLINNVLKLDLVCQVGMCVKVTFDLYRVVSDYTTCVVQRPSVSPGNRGG